MKTFIPFFVFLFLSISAFSQNIKQSELKQLAENFISSYHLQGMHIESCESFGQNDQILFHIVHLFPKGFILMANSKDHYPVLAYSFKSNYVQSDQNPLQKLVLTDLAKRNKYKDLYASKYKDKNNSHWELLLNKDKMAKSSILCWPENGSTTTGGWVEVQWSQNAPYNNVCPMDPISNQRSVAGCPSVAMAQILHFHKTVNGTTFSDEDDYYHNFSGRQYYIDDDFEEMDFLSFPDMNTNLNSLQQNYNDDINPTDLEISSLVFACGVACTQVYSSSVSGTFGVHQAADAYSKFNFSSAELLYPGAVNLYGRMQFNMRHGLPLHLAVVDEAGTVGHNVVLDGWDENDFYHTNFGWGGSYDSWYHIPDDLPYALTVIEGVVLDINYENLRNTAPVSEDIYAVCAPNSSINASEDMFKAACYDAELDSIVKIKIVDLPVEGELTINGNPVIQGQEIDVLEIDLLTYTSTESQTGTESFNFQINDGFEYSENAEFNIEIGFVAIEEMNRQEVFSLYPNPSNGNITLNFLEDGPFSIRILNVLGKEEFQLSNIHENLKLNLSDHTNGVYFVEVQKEGILDRQKIIIER